MSTVNVEAAVEALEKKIEQVKIVDEKAGEESTNENSVESKHEKRSRRKPRIPDDERRRQWEEEQKDKPVIETGVKGQVKWYSVLGHYGFISRADGKKDVFVHQSAIAKSHTIKFYLRTLADDEEVLFDVVEGSQGLEAANVSGPDGTEVKGSRYQNVLLRRRFLNNRFSRNRKDRHENSDKSEKTKDDAEGDVKKRHRRPRRYSKKTASENGAHEDGAEEVKEGEPKARSSPRKNRHQRRNRRRSENGEKKAAEGDRESESEKSQKPGARRRKDSEGAGKTEVRCGSALANGDARLGAEKVDGQV